MLETQKDRRSYTMDIATTILKSVSIFYAFGLIIQNTFFARIGISDFNLAEPRLVLVGFSFIFCLLAPCIPVCGALLGLRFTPLGFRCRLLVAIFLGGILLYVLPFWYQFLFQFGKIPETLSYLDYQWRLWSTLIIIPKIGFAQIGVLFCIIFLFSGKLFDQPRALWQVPVARPLFLTLTIVCALWYLGPYSYGVYPNLSYAWGGGQPKIIEVAVEKSQSELLPPISGQNGNSGYWGPFCLWHQDASFLYISSLKPEYTQGYIQVTAISRSLVSAINILHSMVEFTSKYRNGRLSTFYQIRILTEGRTQGITRSSSLKKDPEEDALNF